MSDKTELYNRAIEWQRKYGGSLSDWIKAAEVCHDDISAMGYVIGLHPNAIRF